MLVMHLVLLQELRHINQFTEGIDRPILNKKFLIVLIEIMPVLEVNHSWFSTTLDNKEFIMMEITPILPDDKVVVLNGILNRRLLI